MRTITINKEEKNGRFGYSTKVDGVTNGGGCCFSSIKTIFAVLGGTERFEKITLRTKRRGFKFGDYMGRYRWRVLKG